MKLRCHSMHTRVLAVPAGADGTCAASSPNISDGNCRTNFILQVAADGNAASGKGRPTDEGERIIGAMLQGRYLALDFGYTGADCSCCTHLDGGCVLFKASVAASRQVHQLHTSILSWYCSVRSDGIPEGWTACRGTAAGDCAGAAHALMQWSVHSRRCSDSAQEWGYHLMTMHMLC